jgi:hypothetical protein
MAEIVNQRLEVQAAKVAEEKRNSRNGKTTVPSVQQTLQNYNFLPSRTVLSQNLWIKAITLKNMPIHHVEFPIQQDLVLYPHVKSSKTVLDTAHHLVMIVEEKIGRMMKKAPAGQILFDGYTISGQHYVALFASFILPYEVVVGNTKSILARHELCLLAVSPLSSLDENNEDKELAEFNAKAHVNFFRTTFKLYGIDYDEWVLCQTADSAAVNIKIAKATHGLHISC